MQTDDAARATAESLAPYQQVSEMETPLERLTDLLIAIDRITESEGDDESNSAIKCIAQIMQNELDIVKNLRSELFRLTHPRREHFEKVGWPA